MTTYRCYGLTLRSDVELPELPQTTAPGWDAEIIRASLSAVPAGADLLPKGLWRSGERCGVSIEGVAHFEARSGTQILVDPSHGADPAQVRLFLLGTVLGALMMQRGHLVLHGNAVRVGDGCVVVLGHSGAGKSTLAAEFARRGHQVLSDDVVPLDAAGNALPGRPRIHLWRDALEQLGLFDPALERVHHQHEKFVVPLADPPEAPLPVRGIYVLERHHADTLDLVAVRGAASYPLLHEHTYRNEWVHGAAAAAAHLHQCARLAATSRINRIRRPLATMTAAATAEAILADAAALTPEHR